MNREDQFLNRNEIIRMAREAGLHLPYWDDDQDPEKDPPRWTMVSPLPPLLERFAALVATHVRETEFKPDWNNYQQGRADGAADEREACAKVCDVLADDYGKAGLPMTYQALTATAKEIRARGQQELAEASVEPVAKPYAYEYGRDNGDGTYSVVIEKGDLVQTAPAVYNYVRPRNAHKDWPIKELFDRPPASKPWVELTDEEMLEVVHYSQLDNARAIEAKLKEKNT